MRLRLRLRCGLRLSPAAFQNLREHVTPTTSLAPGVRPPRGAFHYPAATQTYPPRITSTLHPPTIPAPSILHPLLFSPRRHAPAGACRQLNSQAGATGPNAPRRQNLPPGEARPQKVNPRVSTPLPSAARSSASAWGAASAFDTGAAHFWRGCGVSAHSLCFAGLGPHPIVDNGYCCADGQQEQERGRHTISQRQEGHHSHK